MIWCGLKGDFLNWSWFHDLVTWSSGTSLSLQNTHCALHILYFHDCQLFHPAQKLHVIYFLKTWIQKKRAIRVSFCCSTWERAIKENFCAENKTLGPTLHLHRPSAAEQLPFFGKSFKRSQNGSERRSEGNDVVPFHHLTKNNFYSGYLWRSRHWKDGGHLPEGADCLPQRSAWGQVCQFKGETKLDNCKVYVFLAFNIPILLAASLHEQSRRWKRQNPWLWKFCGA